MATIDNSHFPPVYDDLVDLLAKTARAEDVLSFTLSSENQRRVDELIEKNRSGELTNWESAEWDAFEHFEHVVRLLKARVRERLKG